jgi:hypothetical protein
MSDSTNTEKKPVVINYYIDETNKRIVKTTAQAKAISHFYKPRVRIASTDEVLAHKEAGREIESAS